VDEGLVGEKPAQRCRLIDHDLLPQSLCVLARNSSFSYKVQSVDVKQVGRELGGLNGCDDGTANLGRAGRGC
jgi:hypothetical protein